MGHGPRTSEKRMKKDKETKREEADVYVAKTPEDIEDDKMKEEVLENTPERIVSVFVTKVPYTFTEKTFANLFVKYKKFVYKTRAFLFKNGVCKGFGFVDVIDKENANRIIREMNGLEVEGEDGPHQLVLELSEKLAYVKQTKCFVCGKTGHTKSNCPEVVEAQKKDKENIQNLKKQIDAKDKNDSKKKKSAVTVKTGKN
ncbi:hypothetical protein EIN_205940 [Entamoeba invadens IP1]|uniref:CCHC-type domain-containing protein n=1 Tax=Entamoeba invadens IP1 TaxID=370355 RepID=A0A0A1U9D0_ENTIV|nr:hypothetical protein EIN_205940 [Entamoeba invadens IP1]ELP91627.1 hypothetical protein EIN_205940 [Entamoeba invadens IP1]|eukprot:XP_004258398.1 hypothetical protein EIN_205940 [Entamoeba invadens IP1]